MQFFFCETCGKRITDGDLEQGLGKNKKLKGVYCKECATGVMTMEFEALTNVKLREDPPPAPPPLHSPRLQPAAHSHSHSGRQKNVESTSRAMLAAAGSIFAGALVLLVVFLTSRKSVPAMPEKSVALEAPPVASPRSERLPASAPPAQDFSPSFSSSVELPGAKTAEPAAGTPSSVSVPLPPVPPAPPPAASAETAAGDVSPAPKLTPVNATTPDAQPASTENSKIEEEQLARKAYQDFSAEFSRLLSKADSKSAAARLAQAENDPALKTLREDLALDRKALTWLDEIKHLATEGLKKLPEADHFELRTKSGAPVAVGKREPLQIVSIDGDKITYGDKNVSFSISVDDLHLQTRVALFRLANGSDAHGLFLSAFADWMALIAGAGGDRSAAPIPVTAVRQSLQKAQAAGAAANEIRYLTENVNAIEAKVREALAQSAWDRAAGLCKEKKWKAARQAVQEFSKNYADSSLGRQKQKELEALAADIDDKIAQTEGLVFDFKTPDGVERFKKLLTPNLNYNMEMKSETGALVYRRTNTATGSVSAQSVLKYGKNWEMRIKVNYGISESDFPRIERCSCVALRFLKPGEKASEWLDGPRRFEMTALCSTWGGKFICDWGKENAEAFEGIRRTSGTADVGIGKTGPLSDGKLTLKVSMRQNVFRVETNGTLAAEYQMPANAVAQIAECPLAIFIACQAQSTEISLEEFQFVSRDEK